MTRRGFVKGLFVSPLAVFGLNNKEKDKPLPHVKNGDVIKAESWNDIVDRINKIQSTQTVA